MSAPKLPSQMHPDYPQGRTENVLPNGPATYIPPSVEEYRDFYRAHPEFANEPEYEYRCTSCGDMIDEDHDYCSPCDQRGGAWILIDKNGEEVTNV